MTKNWIRFLEKVTFEIEKLENVKNCDVIFFRGQSDESYELLPSLYRTKRKSFDLDFIENSLFYDFASMAGSQIKNDNSWEILMNMRHHGIPTRLLDWTTSFAVALFFALDSKKLNKPHIWILDPFELSYKNKNFPSGLLNPYYDISNDYVQLFVNPEDNVGIERPEFPLVLYPPRNNNRIFAQQGVFTLHGTNNDKIETQASDCLVKIEIPEDCYDEARKFLMLAGIHNYSVYPDFDGLSKHLKLKYKL